MIELEDDIESDLSALHRIDGEGIERMESARFFRLAERLHTYPGAVAARLAALRAEREQRGPASPAAPTAAVPSGGAYGSGPRPRLWSRAEVPAGGAA